MRLVADVGGTNTRIALCQDRSILADSIQSYRNDDWTDLAAVIAAYLSMHPTVELDDMVIALAGPVHGSTATLTNRAWTIDSDALAKRFNCDMAVLLNDLTALGYAVPVLRTDQIRALGPNVVFPKGHKQSLVVGVGTGFNVSPVLEVGQTVVCPSVEAGHVSMPRSVSEALSKLNCDTHLFPTVETLFSGRGFSVFCQTVTGDASLDGITAMASYGDQASPDVSTAVEAYSELLGWLLRDLALAYMPYSGIYLAGGIARTLAHIAPTPCTTIYQRPSDFRTNTTHPLFAIEDDTAALFGCAQY